MLFSLLLKSITFFELICKSIEHCEIVFGAVLCLICWHFFSFSLSLSVSLFIKSYILLVHSMMIEVNWVEIMECVVIKYRTIERVSTKTFRYHDDLPNDKIIDRQKWFYCINYHLVVAAKENTIQINSFCSFIEMICG